MSSIFRAIIVPYVSVCSSEGFKYANTLYILIEAEIENKVYELTG